MKRIEIDRELNLEEGFCGESAFYKRAECLVIVENTGHVYGVRTMNSLSKKTKVPAQLEEVVLVMPNDVELQRKVILVKE
jgi:hypothetical protein